MKARTQQAILMQTFPELRWQKNTPSSTWMGRRKTSNASIAIVTSSHFVVYVGKHEVMWRLDALFPYKNLGEGTIAAGLHDAAPLLRILYDAHMTALRAA